LTRGTAGGSVSLPMTAGAVSARRRRVPISPARAARNGTAGGIVGGGLTVTFSQAVWASLDAGYNSIGRTGLSLCRPMRE